MQLVSEDWTAEYLHTDGNWYAGRGGPDRDSALAQCRLLWQRRGVRGVRLVRRATTVEECRVR